MEQIFVESNKTYNHGFILKEQDLRRLIDLMNEQFKKISNDLVEYSFQIKYKNGAVATTDEFETIIKQDNEGSSSIVRLEIKGMIKNSPIESSIQLNFKNPDETNEENSFPIKHIVKGQSRDWVFVTSSLIEERISKIKRNQLDPTAASGIGKLLFKLISPLIMLVIMIAMLASVPQTSDELSIAKNKAIAKVEANWKSKKISDPIAVIFEIEKARNTIDKNISTNKLLSSIFLSKPFLIVIGGVIVLFIFIYLITKLYPPYNFYWGNYIEVFDKIENTRKVIIGILLGTIVLGVIVNLLSNVIWEKI